jgi:hypothetical protein
VLALAERLRKDGVDAQLDRYIPGRTGKRMATMDVG